MVQTRSQADKYHKKRISRANVAEKSESRVPLVEVSFSGARKASSSNASTDMLLEEMNFNNGKKGADQVTQSDLQKVSKSRELQALQNNFLHSSSEEGKLLPEGHSECLSNMVISSAERLSDNLQLTCTDRTQILHDASSAFKDSIIKFSFLSIYVLLAVLLFATVLLSVGSETDLMKLIDSTSTSYASSMLEMDISQVQHLSSLQASACKLDTPPTVLDSSVNLTNVKMPKGFQKYLEETVVASIAKTSSEQDTLEGRSYSTLESEPSTPNKPCGKRRCKERCENQQLFQEVLGNDSQLQTSSDSVLSKKVAFSQNTTLSTPLVAQPFGRKDRSLGEADYENVLTHLSTTFSSKKHSSRITDNLSQQSISVTPQAVQPFSERWKRIENENKFEDVLNQPSFRLSPRNSTSGIEDVTQQSIPKSPQAVHPFGKRQKRTQIKDNFEGILSRSSSRFSPRKSSSITDEASKSNISKSPQNVKQFHEEKKGLQNDNSEDILNQPFRRTSPRKLSLKTDEVSRNSVSKSQAVQPFSKRQKKLKNNDFENIFDQSSPRLTPRKSKSKTYEDSQSSISKSPQGLQAFHKRQKKLQNYNSEDISPHSSHTLSVRLSNSKVGEISHSSISKSPRTPPPFGKMQKRLPNEDKFEDKFEDILVHPSPLLSTMKHGLQAAQSFDKTRKREQIENNPVDALLESSVGLSPDKAAVRTPEVSHQGISRTPQAVQLFGKRQQRKLKEVNFEDILSESSTKLSSSKFSSRVEQVPRDDITESPPSPELGNKLQKKMQKEDNLEGTVSQMLPRTSLKNPSSEVGKRQKRITNEDNCEDAVSQLPTRTSPRKLSSKTGGISQAEDNLESTVSQSSPVAFLRKPSSKAGKVSQSCISKSSQAVQLFGKRQKKVQNVDNCEDKLSHSPSKTSLRKLGLKTGDFSQNGISKSPQVVQTFGEWQKRVQNEDSFEDTLNSSSPRTQNKDNSEDIIKQTSPSKFSSKIGNISQICISKSSQDIQQNENSLENILTTSSPRKPWELSLNSISELPPNAQTFSQSHRRIQNEDKVQGDLVHSPPMSPIKSSLRTLEVLQDNISEMLECGKTEQRIQNEERPKDTISPPTPRLSPRKLDTTEQVSQNSFSKSVLAIQPFGKRLKRAQNENNFEDVLSQSSPRMSPRKPSREMCKSSEVKLFADREKKTQENAVPDSSHTLNTKTQLKSIAEHKVSPKHLLAGDAEVQSNSSHNKQRKGVLKHSVTPVHGNIGISDHQESEISLKINEQQNKSSKNHVNTSISSPFAVHKASEADVPQKNTFNICKAPNASPVLTLTDNLKESTDSEKNSAKRHLKNLRETSYDNRISKEHDKHSVIQSNVKHEDASQKVREMIPPQDGVDITSHRSLQTSSQNVNSSHGYKNNKSFLHISSKLQSSHTQVCREGSTEGHSSNRYESDSGSNMLEVQTFHQLANIQKDDSRQKKTNNNAREREVNLNAGCEQQTSVTSRVSLEHKRNVNFVYENISGVSSQRKKEHSLTAEIQSEGSKKFSEVLPTKQGQKHKDLNVLAYDEETLRIATLSPQESVLESITSEQQGDEFSANQELAISIRKSVMRNYSQLPSSKRVEHDTLTEDNSVQNPRNISNQILLAEKHLNHSLHLDSSAGNLHNLSMQKDSRTNLQKLPKLNPTFKKTAHGAMGEHEWEVDTIKSHESPTNNSELKSQVQRTEIIEMVRKDSLEQSKNTDPLSASHVFQNVTSRSFDSARMDSSTSSIKSTTDNSLYLSLQTKRKRYRKLPQLKKFNAETSDSSNVSKIVGAERSTFVRKRKQSNERKISYNSLASTKHIANTEPRVVVHNMASAVATATLADAENAQKVIGHNNMTEYLNREHLHNKVDEHMKEAEYQQFSTKESNYTGLDNDTCRSEGTVKPAHRLFRSWLERRVHQQKKQRKVEKRDKQFQMPLYHQQWTRENEPHNLHLLLKCIAEENVRDKRLEDVVHLSAANTKAKKQVYVKKTKNPNPELMVNGKVYRAPRLARPKQWVNKHLYDYIMPSITAKYGEANSRTKAEEFLIHLCHQVSTVMRRKNYNNYRSNLEKIKKSLYSLGLIRCYNDYFSFIEKYLPFEFRYKAIPCIRAFGKYTGPPWSKGKNIFADLGY